MFIPVDAKSTLATVRSQSRNARQLQLTETYGRELSRARRDARRTARTARATRAA